MDDYLSVANSTAMWVLALVLVSIVVFQALMYLRHALAFSDKFGLLTPEEKARVYKTATITSIGPAVAVFIVSVSLVALIGAPMTLMRIGVIDMLKNYTLPSIYAAVFMMFLGAAKENMHVLVVIVVALIVVALPISEIVNVTAAGVGGILASLLVARFSSGRSEKA